MPLKNHDPFSSSIERLDAKVNPYVALMRDAAVSGSLPILFGPGLKDAAGGWRERIAAYHERTAPSDGAVILVQAERNGLPGPIVGAASFLR